jgi:hypothetical protein
MSFSIRGTRGSAGHPHSRELPRGEDGQETHARQHLEAPRADGQAVLAWPDLLARLATLTLNEAALPLQGSTTFTMLARPTTIQEKTFALLGLPLPRVQQSASGVIKHPFRSLP